MSTPGILPEHQAVIERVKHWRQNPGDFVREVFKAEPEEWQEKAMQALVTHDRVAVRSGHGVGKSTTQAWIIFWWLATRFPAKIAAGAPTAHQLEDILWSELSKWHRRMDQGMQDQFIIKTQKVELAADPKASFAVARTARKEQPEAFQGFHSDNMLFLADEASGIDDIIFEVGKGAMSTEGAKTFLAGNPTRSSGFFYRVFHDMRKLWYCMKVACQDSKQVRPTYPAEVAEEHGENSNVYRIRVLGEFPKEEDDVLIPLHLVESAVEREIDPDFYQYLPVWGIDVARFGDDRSTLCKRCGPVVYEPIKSWKNKRNTELAGIIINEYNTCPPERLPSEILVDVIGIGAGVVDICYEAGLPVRGINVSESPAVKDQFPLLRDELWWKAKQWFETLGVSILDDNDLIAELTAPKMKYTARGKISVEPKEETKKRLLKSPDKADAFVVTFACGVERVAEHRESRYTARKKKSAATYNSWMAV